jgi:hypothetical protein
MTRKPEDDEGFPTSQELSHHGNEEDGNREYLDDPWYKLRAKREKLKRKREALLKRYRDGKL